MKQQLVITSQGKAGAVITRTGFNLSPMQKGVMAQGRG